MIPHLLSRINITQDTYHRHHSRWFLVCLAHAARAANLRKFAVWLHTGRGAAGRPAANGRAGPCDCHIYVPWQWRL